MCWENLCSLCFIQFQEKKRIRIILKLIFLNLPLNKITHKDAMKKSNSQAFFIERNDMFYDYWRLILNSSHRLNLNKEKDPVILPWNLNNHVFIVIWDVDWF